MAKTKTVTEDGEVILADEMLATEYTVFFKTPFNHNRDDESQRTATTCLDPTKTQQHLAAEADINNILAKFLKTGEINTVGQPQYMDIAELTDLQDVIVTSAQVEEAWNALPAAVRNILRDPKTFTDYVDHCVQTGDLEPLRELGLTAKPEPAEPVPPPGGGVSNPPNTGRGSRSP